MTPEALNRWWWLALAAYFMGSVPFGYLIARQAGLRDIRTRGSGDIADECCGVGGAAPRGHALARRSQRISCGLARGDSHGLERGVDDRCRDRRRARSRISAVAGRARRAWRGDGSGGAAFIVLAGCLGGDRNLGGGTGGLALRIARFSCRRSGTPDFYLHSLRARSRALARSLHRHHSVSRLIILRHRANIERLVAGTEARFGAE